MREFCKPLYRKTIKPSNDQTTKGTTTKRPNLQTLKRSNDGLIGLIGLIGPWRLQLMMKEWQLFLRCLVGGHQVPRF